MTLHEVAAYLDDDMVRAKFYVRSMTLFQSPAGSGSVELMPVYKYKEGVSGNACEENRQFWEGSITMSITNPLGFKPFFDAFHAGKPFYVDFTEAPE